MKAELTPHLVTEFWPLGDLVDATGRRFVAKVTKCGRTRIPAVMLHHATDQLLMPKSLYCPNCNIALRLSVVHIAFADGCGSVNWRAEFSMPVVGKILKWIQTGWIRSPTDADRRGTVFNNLHTAAELYDPVARIHYAVAKHLEDLPVSAQMAFYRLPPRQALQIARASLRLAECG